MAYFDGFCRWSDPPGLDLDELSTDFWQSVENSTARASFYTWGKQSSGDTSPNGFVLCVDARQRTPPAQYGCTHHCQPIL